VRGVREFRGWEKAQGFECLESTFSFRVRMAVAAQPADTGGTRPFAKNAKERGPMALAMPAGSKPAPPGLYLRRVEVEE